MGGRGGGVADRQVSRGPMGGRGRRAGRAHRGTRKAVGAGSQADNLSNPLWDELGHAPPAPGRPRPASPGGGFLFLGRWGRGGAGHLRPRPRPRPAAPRSGAPATCARPHAAPDSRGAAQGSTPRPSGPCGTPLPGRPGPLGRRGRRCAPRGPLAEAAGGALLGAEGPAAAEGSEGRAARRRSPVPTAAGTRPPGLPASLLPSFPPGGGRAPRDGARGLRGRSGWPGPRPCPRPARTRSALVSRRMK